MYEVVVEEPDDETAEALLDRYESALEAIVSDVGPERAAEAADVQVDDARSVASGDAAGLYLRDVAEILALDGGAPDAEAILAEVRDNLLLTMSTAMLDVDRIAADVDGDMDPKEIQGKVEGRHPMTLAEYARIHHYVTSKAG